MILTTNFYCCLLSVLTNLTCQGLKIDLSCPISVTVKVIMWNNSSFYQRGKMYLSSQLTRELAFKHFRLLCLYCREYNC